MKKTHIILLSFLGVLLIACLLLCFGKREWTVGEEIKPEKITDFYYTEATSTNPPHYQRYHLYAAEEGYFLFHETREGNHWPLTEADRTNVGSIELTREAWEEGLALLDGGTVVKRQNSTASGSMGPALYLYWKGDRGRVQAFSFPDRGAEGRFLQWCRQTIAG